VNLHQQKQMYNQNHLLTSDMTSTGSGAPLIFADTAKFNGANWVTWNGLIRIAADLWSVFGYLDGAIHNPSPPSLPTETTIRKTGDWKFMLNYQKHV
jgi:hypothetical protein